MKFKMLKKLIASALIIFSIVIIVPAKTVLAKSINTIQVEQIVKKEKNIVYISPSTQYDNSYTKANGINTTEGKVMQEIGELTRQNLVNRGVIVYMNNKNEGVKSHVVRGNSIPGVDCYVALHSNASGGNNPGKAQGILIITRDGKESVKLSKILYQKLQDIYPYKEKSRGIIFNNKYREINGPNAPTLIAEIGFHDNEKDAQFIINNKQKIADAVADAIYEYIKK